MMTDLHNMLESMAVLKASDLYINVGAAPTFKVNGELRTVTPTPLDGGQIKRLILEVLDDEQRQRFEENLELDVSLQITNGGRFRLNIYRQKGALALVARHIKNIIPSIDELFLPDVLKDLVMAEKGLFLVVGATGTGKSSTMASMIDYRNENRQGHILTVEDPIEFVHYHKQSLVSQREIGVDTQSYTDALKFALREAPDVIVIGEIRDQETATQALRFAETGHLCLATLHASSANLAIDRLVNFFPADAHQRIYQDVAAHLIAVVAQRLAKGLNVPRIPAVELLINNMHIASLIEKGETHLLKETMSKEHGKTCQTFDDALFKLVQQKQITKEEANRLADSQVDLKLRYRMVDSIYQEQIFSNVSDWCDHTIDFNRYRTISIEAKKISVEHRPDMKERLNEAIVAEVKNRGYKIVENDPDLALKFSFGLRSTSKNNLSDTDQYSTDFAESPSVEAGIAMKIDDTKTGNTVWKMQATQALTSRLSEQHEFQEEIFSLMTTLPDTSEVDEVEHAEAFIIK